PGPRSPGVTVDHRSAVSEGRLTRREDGPYSRAARDTPAHRRSKEGRMAPDADGKDTATATGGDGASAPARPPRFGVLWKHPDFMKYWTGQAVSLFGTQITIIALPFVAILTLHGTTEQVGLLRFFEFLPFILFSLFVG